MKNSQWKVRDGVKICILDPLNTRTFIAFLYSTFSAISRVSCTFFEIGSNSKAYLISFLKLTKWYY